MERKQQLIGLPFYLFITILLGMLGLFAGVSLWQAQQVIRAAGIALLSLAHIGAYWWNIWHSKSRRWWVTYYTAQTSLIIALAALSYGMPSIAMPIIGSTIICLIGETLGWWGNSRKALLLGCGYFSLALLLLALLLDRGTFYVAVGNLVVNGGFIVLLMVVFNQQLIARQKATELAESLESANAQLAAYASRIETLTLQAERQRMARELHDTLAQGVAGLVLQLEAIKAHLEAQRSEKAATIVGQALARARSTLAESRAVIDDLRLEPPNLYQAIREASERFNQTSTIACTLSLSGNADRIPIDYTNHIVQIVNEALANVLQHAQATYVTITASLHADLLHLVIHDNGIGFDPQQALGNGHYGLLGMHERARLLGGTLTIETAPNTGTRILLVATIVKE